MLEPAEASDELPEREDPSPDNLKLDEGEWAADELHAYQLAFSFIDGEEAAAVGELARFSTAEPLVPVVAGATLLPRPGRRSNPEAPVRRPGFYLTVFPERIRTRSESGGVIAEAEVPLPKRSAVRAAGICFQLDTGEISRLVQFYRKFGIAWPTEEHARWTAFGPEREETSGFLRLDKPNGGRLVLRADEVPIRPVLPKLTSAEPLPSGSAQLLARAVTYGNGFPHGEHRGTIQVAGGVAKAASWDQTMLEYREPGLGAFDFAMASEDAKPFLSALKRLKGSLRQLREEDGERLILSNGEVAVSLAAGKPSLPQMDAAKDNAEKGLKVSLSVARLRDAASVMAILSKDGSHLVRFEVREDPDGRKLYLTGETPDGRGHTELCAVSSAASFDLAIAYVRANPFARMLQPWNFDAAELFLGSYAARLIQYRGQTSLTHIFAYAPIVA